MGRGGELTRATSDSLRKSSMGIGGWVYVGSGTGMGKSGTVSARSSLAHWFVVGDSGDGSLAGRTPGFASS